MYLSPSRCDYLNNLTLTPYFQDMHGSQEAAGISRLNPLQHFLSAAAVETHPAPPGDGAAPGDGAVGGGGELPGASFATLNGLSVSHAASSFTGSSTEFASVAVMLDGSAGERDRTPQTDDDAQRLLVR